MKNIWYELEFEINWRKTCVVVFGILAGLTLTAIAFLNKTEKTEIKPTYESIHRTNQ